MVLKIASSDIIVLYNELNMKNHWNVPLILNLQKHKKIEKSCRKGICVL